MTWREESRGHPCVLHILPKGCDTLILVMMRMMKKVMKMITMQH